jgi:hypothetical protein
VVGITTIGLDHVNVLGSDINSNYLQLSYSNYLANLNAPIPHSSDDRTPQQHPKPPIRRSKLQRSSASTHCFIPLSGRGRRQEGERPRLRPVIGGRLALNATRTTSGGKDTLTSRKVDKQTPLPTCKSPLLVRSAPMTGRKLTIFHWIRLLPSWH